VIHIFVFMKKKLQARQITGRVGGENWILIHASAGGRVYWSGIGRDH
jgi:hypothetical protein